MQSNQVTMFHCNLQLHTISLQEVSSDLRFFCREWSFFLVPLLFEDMGELNGKKDSLALRDDVKMKTSKWNTFSKYEFQLSVQTKNRYFWGANHLKNNAFKGNAALVLCVRAVLSEYAN